MVSPARFDFIRNPTVVGVFGLVVSLLAGMPSWAQPEAGYSLVDRIVAVVNDEPVLLSDVERAIAIHLGDAQTPTEPPKVLRRRTLDRLIDQQLRLREVERFATDPIPAADVEAQRRALRDRHRDDAEWHQYLAAVGLDDDTLRHLLRRQLRVLRYVEEHLEPRVFVSPDDVQAYYQGTLRDALAAAGEEMPPLEQVRDDIRAVLHARRLNEEIAAWTMALRERATIADLLDAPPPALPPVTQRIE